ncbi:MAG: PAS domain S-box protein [Rhodoferax sp.]|uniref:PAS domain-containing sensor histidine kinase n=1 Tax=Rhodoferax sp. TaxID=50421 RepID=UPI002631F953|nr:PAS domain-containing sensor histidine kinase [Rhodoferax sp.]MDD5334816.1 PAS domain S-box protein [Rhodoferax sp.]
MPLPRPTALPNPMNLPPLARLQGWWRRLTPQRQDRFAMLAPLAAVLLFLAAIVAAFGYLRLEEIDREQEAVRRDVEYTQQRLRLRLLERQEQLMRVAREVSNRELDADDFQGRAETLINRYPELQSLSWIDERKRIKASVGTASLSNNQLKTVGSTLHMGETESAYSLARDLQQPIYAQRSAAPDNSATLQLHIPLSEGARFAGVLLAEYSVDGLFRYGVPAEVSARYAVSFHDAKGGLLAGMSIPARNPAARLLPWDNPANVYEVPVSPVGNGLVIRGQAYRTSLGVIGSGLFWLVTALSAMTAWMLIANWRHTRRRMQAQQALVSETVFRRAMENSMLTGMRALDLQGRITYVNAAFCQMTGWNESDLVGRTAPFPYWPEADLDSLNARLEEELAGKVLASGIQFRVKRKNGTLFDARLYVSPLIDAHGVQTGWMTSMTDITEPNRIRDQLSASHERFTTVLEALDASISVAPLGSDELLFANKLYRLWFGTQAGGHLQLVAEAGVPVTPPSDESLDNVDAFAGLPTDSLPDTEAESSEVYLDALGKWLEVRTRYLSWVDGRLAQMVIATDITARRIAEAQAAAQTERAQTASRLITMGEMASSVAHELNQPLTAINNYCNGMVSRIKGQQISEEDLLSALEKTAKQAQRAGQIIQRIRSFVKRSEPNRSLSEVAAMVDEALELAEIEMRRRNVRLTHYVAPRIPALLVDPILIEQVLVNLLKNAADSIDSAQRPTAQRSVRLRVVPTQVNDKPAVEFMVIDSGQGLAPEVMARLYESFYSTKADGMGIGLSLCRSIVESHLGRMKAENIYNGAQVTGCCFSFWIPVTESLPTVGTAQTTKDARVKPG